MAGAGAAARTWHPAERVGVGGGEGVEPSGVALGGEERQLAARHRLVLVADLVDGDRLRVGGEPPDRPCLLYTSDAADE